MLAEEYSITLPEIAAAALAPNPIAAGGALTLTVTVTEITKILYPEKIYSGEIYAGEAF